ncbi:MAG: alpha/beta hydrolase [Rhodobacteraceae bacterium]|nr:alpha/beta hydrolase [Paracoccaceae bacterium]
MTKGDLAGCHAYWRVDGHGPRRAFMLHCTFAHSGAWKKLMAELGDVFTSTAMDLPGHGRSGGRDRAYSWQGQSVAMAIELIEKDKGPVDLIGHSFGATVAIRIAVERPDLVRSLTIIEPVFFSAAKDAGHPEFDHYLAHPEEFIAHLEVGELEKAARAFSDRWGDGTKWYDLPEAQREYMAARIPLVAESASAAMGIGRDYVPLTEVAAIRVPVLLIEGAKTEPIVAATQQSLASVLPQAKRVIVPTAGHMVPITHPAQVGREIRSYLKL